MRFVGRKTFWGACLASLLLIGGGVLAICGGAFLPGRSVAIAVDEPSPPVDPEGRAVAVRTIHPKCDPAFVLSVRSPAQVEAYEAVDLESQVAGQVEFIRKAEGSRVTAGELLLKIAVPDLDEEVKQKDSIVLQRISDSKVARAFEKVARSAIAVAQKNIEVQEAEVLEATAMEDFRGKEFKRFKGLIEDKAATRQIVEERERYYQASVGGTAKAHAMVFKAKADLEEAQAKLEAASADVELKQSLVEVARKDRDKAQALANYSKIKAPFDGVVTHRGVNQGSFVQNATTSHTEPLIRVERRDIVTVTMKVPDTFASYVNNETEAVIEMSELPGQEIHGKVTRFSPTLESASKDHTLVVQVDLYNGLDSAYQAFLAMEKAKKVPFDDLKEGPLPLAPKLSGKGAVDFRDLYPGMYGEMTLIFRHLPNVYLLPSDAVVRQGGTPFIYLVDKGKATLTPIEVQVDDQKVAKVALMIKTPTGTIKRDLTGNEEVIYSNQTEITDAEPVQTIPEEWMP